MPILLSQYRLPNRARRSMKSRPQGPIAKISTSENQMFKRNGFSLIEFAIVTLILGIAIVIMVPVVLKSQTEARQMGCATRMGNLARAVLAYEDSNGRLPPAGIVDPVGNSALAQQVGSFDSRSGPQFSWIVLTLPYFNQQSVFDAFDLSTDVTVNQRRRLVPS